MRPTKRSLGLPPLSGDNVSERKPPRLNQLLPAVDMATICSRSLPKVYPRLQTLTELTSTYVRDLHFGNFVTRSELRWQNFIGQDSPNSARDRSLNAMTQSAALVIQCIWRRYAAMTLREHLKKQIWQRQIDTAARITQHSSCLTQALQVKIISEKNRLQAVASVVPIRGFYLDAPARLLSWWMEFTCAQVVAKRILRHSPVSMRAIEAPVKRTRRKLMELWRYVVPLAVLVLQCCVRGFLARQTVGKRKLERLKTEAALRLQRFIRVYYAQHIAKRLRRSCAAIRIQCLWRCYDARKCLQQRRMTWIATSVCTLLLRQAVKQASDKLRVQSARIIQKHYRGCRARAQFREVLSRHQEQKWRKNPSKGFDLFELKRYDQAALFLEICFRQGIFTEEAKPTVPPVQNNQNLVRSTSRSRMSFSFSTAPTKFGTDWILQHDNFYNNEEYYSNSDAMSLAGRLHFWQAYAISHFRVFEATGNVFNLNQARVGWESYLQVDAVAKTWTSFQAIGGSLFELRFRSQYELARCIFWSGKHSEKDKALSISLSLLKELSTCSRDVLSSLSDITNLEAQLLMLSSMLYFEQRLFVESCSQLEKLLNVRSQTVFSDLEVRFTLALMLLKRYEENYVELGRASKTGDPEANTFLRTATQLLQKCYRTIELWPSVGFYHGQMKKNEAKRLLISEQVGCFLLYHQLDTTCVHKHVKSASAKKIILQVKLSDRPLRFGSLRIELSATGMYKTRKMPDHLGHFSLHGLVANISREAGVQMELGIQKSIYTPSLRQKLEGSQPKMVHDKSKLLNWDEWERKIHDTAIGFSNIGKPWIRRNETWSAVCFEIAKVLECSETWTFAEVAAREALLHSKDCFQRANVNFLAARVAMNMQKRNESVLLMQQARLEMIQEQSIPNRHFFIDNLTAIQRALSPNVSISKQESFSSRLERLQKLERLCLKAWRYHSLALRLRGDSFREALLLQRVADEMYAECGDTFFIRSLLKAHLCAYVGNGLWYESLHLKCAYTCVAWLFKRFHMHQNAWTNHLTSLTDHMQDKAQVKKSTTKTREFNVKVLLLSWHHMPFILCFEMAEVLYRYRNHSASTLIDVYESLLGRLRASQPQISLYAAYEELILLRLSFLQVTKVSTTKHSWLHLDAAVSAIDEILEQRKNHKQLFTSETVKKQAKMIKWPSFIRLPFDLSDAEVFFIRGYFVQLKEDLMQIPVERRSSWRDYDALHQELMELVKKASPPGEVAGSDGRMLNCVRYRAENLRALRILVGATHDVTISNMMLSQPFVAIQLEGKTTPTRSPPTWTNLSPSWEEDIEMPASSSRANNVIISVRNRTRRHSRWQDADTIGYVSVAMHDLLSAHDGVTQGRYYELTLVKSPNQAPSRGSEERHCKIARIYLSFQVILKPQIKVLPSANRTATWATRSGNWDVEDVRAHLHGDLQVFVSTRWIWSRFARDFMQDKDLFIAKCFFIKAVRLTSELQQRTSKSEIQVNTSDMLAIGTDLIGLSRCYRANSSTLMWREQAVPLLEQAESILTRKISLNKRDYCSVSDNVALEKQLIIVRELLGDACGASKMVGPLEEGLSRKTPATSEWVKMTNRRASGGISTRYFNQDTGETFHSKWRTEPLEYEDKETVIMEEQARLLHRIVLMTSEMKVRVSFHRKMLLQLHAEDPFEWVAVFNNRKKEFQFYSPHFFVTYTDPTATKYPARPPTYVLLADEFLLYHVLVVQDAYRKYRHKRQRQRRIRGVILSVCLIYRELVATRRRQMLQSFNCVRVVVEKAQHLRAGDLLSSDPFVKLTLTDPSGEIVATGETSVRYNSLNPKWNEEFHFRYSLTEHEILQQTAASSLSGDTGGQMREALLILKIVDYDVVLTRKENRNEKDRSGDFLGMVTIPIQTFIHGKHMTADLPLLDEKGRQNSPRTRGSLTVSVQWTHCEEEEVTNVTRLWAIGRGGSRAFTTKKANDRPQLPEEAAQEVDLLHQQMEQLLQLLLSMATEVLEPMHRLQYRIKIAQTKGKTAEEAKVLEQRLNGLLRTQLLPKLKLVQGFVCEQIDGQLPVVLKKLFGHIEEYYSSFEPTSRRELRSSMENCINGLNMTTYSLKKHTAEDVTPANAITMACGQYRLLNLWNDQFREILETFFIGIKTQWKFTLEENLDEMYSKLSAENSPHDGGSRRGEGKAMDRPAIAAVAKRKERVERAKQEKAWYELQ